MCERRHVNMCSCDIEYGVCNRSDWCEACRREFDEWVDEQAGDEDYAAFVARLDARGGWEYEELLMNENMSN